MSKISKRLLSWLCVIAMVLSFVPVMDLSNLAVTTQAAGETGSETSNTTDTTETTEPEIEYGSNNWGASTLGEEGVKAEQKKASDIQTAAAAFELGEGNMAICPVCGGEAVQWVDVSALAAGEVPTITTTAEKEHIHLYFAGEVDISSNGNAVLAHNESSICILLKEATVTTAGLISATADKGVINVMGTGTITSDGAKCDDKGLFLLEGTNNTLNLYGGTIVYTGEGMGVSELTRSQEYVAAEWDASYSAVSVAGAGNVLNMYPGVVVGPELGADGEVDDSKPVYNVRVTNGTFNMYGGTIQNGVVGMANYEKVTNTYLCGNLYLRSGAATANIYDGLIQNGTFLRADAALGQTIANWGGNIVSHTGNLNMYGGTVTGGKANNGGNGGGNIFASGRPVFMGGTISDGYARAAGGNLQVYNAVIGGTVWIKDGYAKNKGGNVLASGALTITGGKISGGIAGVQGSGEAGIDDAYKAALAVPADPAASATTRGAYGKSIGTKGFGGNIYAKVNVSIEGGIITEGTAYMDYHARIKKTADKDGAVTQSYEYEALGGGGNIYLENASSTAVDKRAKLTITGGTVSNGIAEASGGNIYLNYASATIGEKVKILNGKAQYPNAGGAGGGNIFMYGANTVVETSGVIMGGQTTGYGGAGGNINVGTSTTFIMNGGVLADGWVHSESGTAWGGNIRCWAGTVEILGGLIYGGKRGSDGLYQNAAINVAVKGSGSKFTIGGDAIIVGEADTDASTTLTLKDNPQILPSYKLEDGTVVKAWFGCLNVNNAANISELGNKAKIYVNNPVGKVLTVAREGAADLAGCFKTCNGVYGVTANDSEQLVVSNVNYQAPAKDDTNEVKIAAAAEIAMTVPYQVQEDKVCPMCGATGVTWTQVKADKEPGQKTTAGAYHYYVNAATDKIAYNWYTANKASGFTLCLLLGNGDVEKNIGGWIGLRTGATNSVLNVMGNGRLTSNSSEIDDAQFGLLSIQGGHDNTMNLYGGTFTFTGDCESREKGTTTRTGIVYTAAINVKGYDNTINMYDGVTIGPELKEDGTVDTSKAIYNVRIEPTTSGKTCTMNMYGGVIQNGVSAVVGDATASQKAVGTDYSSGNVTLYSGLINSVAAKAQPVFNMYGGVITGGSHTGGNNGYGGNITLNMTHKSTDGNETIYTSVPGAINIYGGTVKDGKAEYGGNIFVLPGANGLKMYGGTVTGGSAKNGGNIHISSRNAYATISGGTISNGTATNKGGNITVWQSSGSKVTITGKDTLITGGTAAIGGNISTDAILSITDSVISNGFASSNGGNIYVGTSSANNVKVEILGKAQLLNGIAGCEEKDVPAKPTEAELEAAVDAGKTSVSSNSGHYGNGGNLCVNSTSKTRAITIGEDVLISGGFAAPLYTAKYNSQNKYEVSVSYGNGGNVYINSAVGSTVALNGTIKDGKAYGVGGNLYVASGEVNFNATVDNGYSNEQGGNVGVIGTNAVLNVQSGEIKNGRSRGQGGNVRCYQGTINMTNGKIYGGQVVNNAYDTDNVWLVLATFNMSGGEIVATDTAAASGLAVTGGGTYYCTVTLSGTAKITGGPKAMLVQKTTKEGVVNPLYIDKDFAGEAHVYIDTDLSAGDDVPTARVVTGSWVTQDDATTFQLGDYAGNGDVFFGPHDIEAFAKTTGQLCLGTGAAIVTKDAEGKEVKTQYPTDQAAVNAFNNEGYVLLGVGGDIAISNDVTVDLNGNAANFTGTGTVSGLDNSNDSYESYAKLTVTAPVAVANEATNAVNGNRYIALKETDGTWGFHRVEMKLTHISLRTTMDGIYYKAEIKADDVLAERVNGFGTMLNAFEMPYDINGEYTQFTSLDKFKPENHVVTTTTCDLFGILKDVNTLGEDGTAVRDADGNAKALKTAVYANLYMNIDVTGDGISDDDFDAVAYTGTQTLSRSLLDVVSYINGVWETANYQEPVRTNMINFVNKWNSEEQLGEGLADWQAAINNIK